MRIRNPKYMSLTCVHQSAQNKPMILFNPTVYDIFNFRYWDFIYGSLLITYIIMTSIFLPVHSPSPSLNSNFIFLNCFCYFQKARDQFIEILILSEVLLKIKYPGFFLLHNTISNRYANSFNPFSILSIILKFIENVVLKQMHYIKSTFITNRETLFQYVKLSQ